MRRVFCQRRRTKPSRHPLRVVLLSLTLLTDPCWASPAFIDRAAEQDFNHVYGGGWEFFVGGGVAVFDCNQDHFPELFVAGGEHSTTGNTKIEASGNFEAKGLQVTIEASTKLEAKGATSTLSGSAMAEVKGALVKIN